MYYVQVFVYQRYIAGCVSTLFLYFPNFEYKILVLVL